MAFGGKLIDVTGYIHVIVGQCNICIACIILSETNNYPLK